MDTQDHKQLVFHDSAMIIRIAGAVFLILGGIFYLTDRQWYELIFISASVVMILFSGDLTVTADRSTRTLRLEYLHLLYRNTVKIPFDDIEDIRVQHSYSTSRGHTSSGYRMVAVLKNGRTVPFHLYHDGEGDKKQQAARLRAFIAGGTHKTTEMEGEPAAQITQAAGSDQSSETKGK